MKIKTTLAVLFGLAIAVNVFAQGQVVFRNTTASAVIMPDGVTRVPPGTALAGLYYSTDLAAVNNPAVAFDGWTLAATTPIAPSAAFAGVYSGGTVTLANAPVGSQVILQVRAWSTGFTSYESAFAGPSTTLIGNSAVLGSRTPAAADGIYLGGGSVPIPNISTVVGGFTLHFVPEPSVLVLGLLGGLGAMILLRRKS
jgi:hypothetical protein